MDEGRMPLSDGERDGSGAGGGGEGLNARIFSREHDFSLHDIFNTC